MLWLRPPVVAGRFYPADKNKLLKDLETFYSPETPKKNVMAVMAPHAGYIYSGRYAGDVYRQVAIPKTVFILAPNHTGRGPKISVWSEGFWETPLGRIPVQEEVAGILVEELGLRDGDMQAHASEHAIEVQLPFLQYQRPDVEIVPIVLGSMRVEQCEFIGAALAKVIEGDGNCLVVASTDMSHYIPAIEAKRQDQFALDEVKKISPQGLYKAVGTHDISMCGVIPTTAVLAALNKLGAKNAEMISYGHSGEVTGDDKSVVAYASALFL